MSYTPTPRVQQAIDEFEALVDMPLVDWMRQMRDEGFSINWMAEKSEISVNAMRKLAKLNGMDGRKCFMKPGSTNHRLMMMGIECRRTYERVRYCIRYGMDFEQAVAKVVGK